MIFFTFYNDYTVSEVRAQAVGGNTLVFARVSGLAVDDLNCNDTIGVSDGIQTGIQLLPTLEPFDGRVRSTSAATQQLAG